MTIQIDKEFKTRIEQDQEDLQKLYIRFEIDKLEKETELIDNLGKIVTAIGALVVFALTLKR